MTDSSRLLDGLTVLDFTRVLAGPYCTRLMADLGARVLKVERPGEGDDTRRGYIQLEDEKLPSQKDMPEFTEFELRDVFLVRRFAEKPDIDTARRFVESGDFLWNSGMFIWRVDAIAEALGEYTQEVHEQIFALPSESDPEFRQRARKILQSAGQHGQRPGATQSHCLTRRSGGGKLRGGFGHAGLTGPYCADRWRRRCRSDLRDQPSGRGFQQPSLAAGTGKTTNPAADKNDGDGIAHDRFRRPGAEVGTEPYTGQ